MDVKIKFQVKSEIKYWEWGDRISPENAKIIGSIEDREIFSIDVAKRYLVDLLEHFEEKRDIVFNSHDLRLFYLETDGAKSLCDLDNPNSQWEFGAKSFHDLDNKSNEDGWMIGDFGEHVLIPLSDDEALELVNELHKFTKE
jgi:hypothetical protein